MASTARKRGMAAAAWLLLAACATATTGCRFSGPPSANPALVGRPSLTLGENPLFVAQAHDPQQYQRVFDTTYDVLNDYFDIAASNIFAGQILGVPRITAGYWDGPRYDWYDGYQLFESSLQTVRRRAVLNITPAECGGYFI